MAALDFPNAPTLNQVYLNYTWDGEKWLATAGSGGSSVYVSDTPPAGAADKSLWWESDTGILYVRYNDGTSTQWVAIVAGSAGSAVLYDTAQSLTEPQRVQARQNVYAAPFDALAYNGMQINGGCEISQERGNTSFLLSSGASPYIQDGWVGSFSTTTTLQVSAFPATVPPPPAGFNNAIGIQAATGLASLAAADYALMAQFIEGYRASRLAFGTANAQPVTIAFWVLTSVAGTMAVSVRNSAANRTYVADVVINTAATTWEYKTVTIPGDIAGTWLKDTGIGLRVAFCFASGTTFRTAANVWTASNAFATPATTNFMATTGNSCYITGLVVLPGIEAPSAARSPFIMRPYDLEYQECLRYLEVWDGAGANNAPLGMGVWNSSTAFYATYAYKQRKRAIPTVTPNAISNFVGSFAGGAIVAFTSMSAAFISPDAVLFGGVASSGVGVVGQSGYMLQNGGGPAKLIIDARLF